MANAVAKVVLAAIAAQRIRARRETSEEMVETCAVCEAARAKAIAVAAAEMALEGAEAATTPPAATDVAMVPDAAVAAVLENFPVVAMHAATHLAGRWIAFSVDGM